MKIKTIIIDDHQLFNDGLCMILKESGFFDIVEQVFDSRQAVFQTQKHVPKLILLDLNMPYLNGVEVAQQLKELPFKVIIVVISMYAERKEIGLFQKLGIDGYITKTTPAKELITILKKIVMGEKIFESFSPQKINLPKDNFTKQFHLTKRELEVIKALKKGLTTEQIATTLNLSYYTVETHRKNINQKMKFTSKKEFYDFLETIQLED